MAGLAPLRADRSGRARRRPPDRRDEPLTGRHRGDSTERALRPLGPARASARARAAPVAGDAGGDAARARRVALRHHGRRCARADGGHSVGARRADGGGARARGPAGRRAPHRWRRPRPHRPRRPPPPSAPGAERPGGQPRVPRGRGDRRRAGGVRRPIRGRAPLRLRLVHAPGRRRRPVLAAARVSARLSRVARTTALVLALAWIAIGARVDAEHEVYYRYTVLGFVKDAHGRPLAGTQLELVREKTGFSYVGETDAEGVYLIIARLGDESVGEPLSLRSGRARRSSRASIRPTTPTNGAREWTSRGRGSWSAARRSRPRWRRRSARPRAEGGVHDKDGEAHAGVRAHRNGGRQDQVREKGAHPDQGGPVHRRQP